MVRDMTNALSRLLETRDWLMADGATGTNLFNMGLSSGDAPEMWNVEHPEKIKALYAGAGTQAATCSSPTLSVATHRV